MKIKKESYKKRKINDILTNENIENKKLALEQVLNLSKPELLLNKNKELTKKNYKEYKRIIKKLNKGLPIQYITKKANFYGKEYYVNKNTLIPRPETEILVHKTNQLIEKHMNNKNINILEIGTGSGIIAITLKKLNKNYNITATDISKKAIKVAKKNAKTHNTTITFKKTDLYKGINKTYDIIISNPPYIEENSQNIEKIVKDNEPKQALFGGKDGLDYYRRILKDITKIINKNHIIALEIGENQGQKIKKIIKKYLPKDKIIIKKDYNNYDRYIYIISKDQEK